MPSLDSVQPDLRDALTFASSATQSLAFTSWDTIKIWAHAMNVTSASPMEERRDFLASLTEGQAAASAFGLRYFAHQAEQWGWDTTDLAWEATVQGEGAPVFILCLRDDFDMEGLRGRFETRDFARTEHGGAIVYTHPLDLTVDWRTELAVFNAAVLPDEKILIHASDPGAILRVLDAHAGDANWQGDAGALSVAAAFGPVAAVLMAPGAQACADLGFAALLPLLPGNRELSAEALADLQREYFGEAPLHPYQMLGIGYYYLPTRPVGVVAMHYASEAEAQADLPARRQLVEKGRSIVTKAPLWEGPSLPVTVVDSRNNILVNGRPAGDRPRRLFDMFYRRDLPFAACS